jgi:hypothetical protein
MVVRTAGVGLGEGHEPRHLPGQHSSPAPPPLPGVLLGEPEQRQRDAHLVVEVAFRLEGLAAPATRGWLPAISLVVVLPLLPPTAPKGRLEAPPVETAPAHPRRAGCRPRRRGPRPARRAGQSVLPRRTTAAAAPRACAAARKARARRSARPPAPRRGRRVPGYGSRWTPRRRRPTARHTAHLGRSGGDDVFGGEGRHR